MAPLAREKFHWYEERRTTLKVAYDVIAFGAHPDDLEVVLGDTTVKLVRKGLSVLFVDLREGEPTRRAARGRATRRKQKPQSFSA